MGILLKINSIKIYLFKTQLIIFARKKKKRKANLNLKINLINLFKK